MATAPTYASELNIIGFSTGGTPANISANTIVRQELAALLTVPSTWMAQQGLDSTFGTF